MDDNLIHVRLKVNDEVCVTVALTTLPRVGELLSFEAPAKPDYWSAEIEQAHRVLESRLWVVKRVIHLLRRQSAHPQDGCHQAITVYLGSAEAPLD